MRPHVILNAAMTLDGKIATRAGDSAISSPVDLVRVHELRREVDGIMVGINTVLRDDPRLTVHRVPSLGKTPTRVVVDSTARTPLNARLFGEEGRTIVAVSERAEEARLDALRAKAQVIVCGREMVDLKGLMERLHALGMRTLLLEGGGNLNWSMLSQGLVDEVRVAIASRIVGGRETITLVEGEGHELVEEGIKLELVRYYPLGEDLVLEYRVLPVE